MVRQTKPFRRKDGSYVRFDENAVVLVVGSGKEPKEPKANRVFGPIPREVVEAGYQPEMAYFECLHELKLIVDLMVESGISGMRFSISETAKYGDITRGPRVINSSSRKAMREILKEIQTGKFARQWIAENKAGAKKYRKMLKDDMNHPIEKVGVKLRARMPWLQENR